MITLEDANNYFQNHLDGAKWLALAEETRSAALQMGARDIAARLNRESIDPARIFQLYAACEQAIFLALDESGRRELFVESEQIEGLGSVKYALPSKTESGWSPRALRFIECELNLFPRIGRG